MGKKFSGDLEEGFARVPREIPIDRKKAEEEAYRKGRNTGYHLGYSLGFESGYEKGYIEGSTLGYNNGFLAALGLGEVSAVPGKTPEIYVCQILQKLITRGQVRLFISGCAAEEAKALLKLINIDVAVVKRETKM